MNEDLLIEYLERFVLAAERIADALERAHPMSVDELIDLMIAEQDKEDGD